MAEQCIVCLDTLLHAIEPPPPPLPDDSGSPSTTTTTTSTTTSNTTSNTTATTTASASATTTVLTINTLIPFDSSKSDPPTTTVSALATREPSSTVHAASSHDDANEVDVSSDAKSLEDDNVAVIQICGHTLHNTCLKEWTAKANSCPICRQNFNIVEVYDKIGGTRLSTYTVEDKKQVAEFDAQAIFDDFAENLDDEVSTPCPVCDRDDHEEVLLLCDGCDTAYHTHCIGLESVPEGAWFCMECVTLFGEAVNGAQGSPAAGLGRNAGHRTGTGRGRRDFFPRTRHSMRRVDRRARSDQWQGAWGQITGHVWDALNIDLDHDEDDALEEFRRVERRRDNERREFQRWQERLDIARRLGAQHIFERSIPSAILQHASRHGGPSHASSASARAQVATVQQSQEERRAWGDFERARDRDQPAQPSSRKRKSRSTTGSPVEPQPEPERKLKRPRTRRIGAPSEAGPSASAPAERAPTSATRGLVSAAFSPVSASSPPAPTSPSPPAPFATARGTISTISTANSATPSMRSPPPQPDQPSFLSSLLKEVEMSTPADDENIRWLFGEAPHPSADPSSPVASSPAASAYSSPRAMSTTPPPHRPLRASSPTTLSSHILPVYPPANYSPTRSAASPSSAGAGGDNSDSDDHTRGGNSRNNRRSPSAVEIRQPRPRRMPPASTARSQERSQETSPSRHSLSLEMKENISSIVRSALNPHWKSSQLTADQYAAINRDVSRKLYEEVTNPAVVGSEMRRIWEQKASREVARAVADLQA